MKEEINKYEKFEQYLKGELSTDEKNTFQNKLENDVEFNREFLQHEKLFNIINDKGYIDVKENIRQIHSRKLRINKYIRNTGIGISILVSGMILYSVFISSKKDEDIVNEETTEIADNNSQPLIHSIPRFEKDTVKSVTKKINNNKAAEIKVSQQVTENNRIEDIPDLGIKNQVRKIVNPEKKDSLFQHKIILSPDRKINNTEPAEMDTAKMFDCSKIEIYSDVTIKESCNNKSTGEIQFVNRTISGGNEPYSFSIDNGQNYYSKDHFTSLKSGIYHLFIKDKNNCFSRLGSFRISSINCTYEHAFAPLKLETWEVPTEHRAGTLSILSRSGNLVFKRNIEAFEVYKWDGKTEEGVLLPMGIFQFIIKFRDGEEKTGSITIIK